MTPLLVEDSEVKHERHETGRKLKHCLLPKEDSTEETGIRERSWCKEVRGGTLPQNLMSGSSSDSSN